MSDRLGVRGRLFLAFVGISAFAVLAAAAAMYSFLEAGKALHRITQQRVPAAVASQKLSRQAERIAAAAPALLAVDSEPEHDRMSGKIAAELDRLEILLGALRNREIEPGVLGSIEALVDLLGVNLKTIDTMIFNNLVLIERRIELLRDHRLTDIAARRLLAPGILVMDAKLAELRRALDPPTSAEDRPARRIDDLAASIVSLAPLARARAEVSALNNMLIEAAAADSETDLDVMVLPLRRSLESLGRLLGSVEPGLARRLRARLAGFRHYANGTNGIVSARRRELRHLALIQNRLDENIDISSRLTAAVDRLVSAANKDIQNANLEALSVQRSSTVIMATVVVLSLLCSVLIVWLYVGRHLTARLTALSEGMMAIAGGDLEAPIPAGGTDEIGDMAKALIVFRDTAREVRETNLREIRDARRRLIDAVESISEGFSLYDAEDRLVLSNSRYRQELYPAIADVMVPGTPFETIVKCAAERGLIEDAKGRIDEWVARRLAHHRDLPGPHLQHQTDGRWIHIDERRTEDGGTVAVYADVSQLKQREEELAEKSNALEQLSTQLAKFLPPQVYDSVFSGKQEVKIASSRKKLTVFFSDIAGFTEISDRLESEELTRLVNHYLTEMSKIALEFGATIDKYMGDGILIFFGDPETRGDREDALACVKMAIAMRERLRELGHIWREAGIEKPLRVRMGIHTGYCTVGNFGSEDRMDYTIIGGGANTASRLESRATPGEILISYETFAHVKSQILCEEKGRIEVKGIAYPIATYQVVDSHENLARERRHLREDHPNVKLDLDFEAMSLKDRSEAEAVLRRALELLADEGAPAEGNSGDRRRRRSTDKRPKERAASRRHRRPDSD